MSDKLTSTFQQRITNNRETILPEPTIGNNRLADYIGNESINNTSTSVSDPNAGRVNPQYSYPILVVELNTAYSKKVLEEELTQVENKYKTYPDNAPINGQAGVHGNKVSIFILMDAEAVDKSKGTKTLVYWRKAIIDIDFLNCLEELMINYRYLKSKGCVIDTKEHLEQFLDYEDIGKNIIDDSVILDYGLDKIEEDVDLSSDLLFTNNITQSIIKDTLKDTLEDKPITIQDQLSKELTQHQYEDLDDINIDLTKDSVDILSQTLTNTNMTESKEPINKPIISVGAQSTLVDCVGFGQEV